MSLKSGCKTKINDNKKLFFQRNYHYLIEVSVMIDKSGLGAVPPFFKNNNFVRADSAKRPLRMD
jgi:hypothetical protein